MWVYEPGRRFSSLVEATADTIAARSTEPSVRLQALRWKTGAIPLIEGASLLESERLRVDRRVQE